MKEIFPLAVMGIRVWEGRIEEEEKDTGAEAEARTNERTTCLEPKRRKIRDFGGGGQLSLSLSLSLSLRCMRTPQRE